MKKILLSFLLLMAVVYAKATFTPNPTTLYNIKQLNSGLIIGQNGTTPCLQSAKQKSYQAFYFVPVDGMTDTYYLINGDNSYLNKKTTVDWDYWDVVYESAANGANSQWTIIGEADGFRLQLVANSKYLASDNTTENSGIYCDKAADNVNGVYVAEPAEVVSEYFDVTEKGFELQVEKGYQPYPVHFSTGNIYEDIFAKAPEGFTISKSVFTPDDVLNANHNCSFTVSTSAAAGTKGTIYFAIGSGSDEIIFDSVQVVSVEKQPRFFIVNNSNTNLVIGNYSTDGIPALTINVGDTAQQFILRHAYPTLPDSLSYLKDSLYYIIQDGTYRTMAKDLPSGWDVIFGAPIKEAIWKITPEQDGTVYSIKNFVTDKYLGTDALAADARLYDDKAFVLNPTSKPYSVWKVISADQVVVPKIFNADDGGYALTVEKDYKAYPVHITTSGIKDIINVKPSAGFNVDKSSFTTDEVAALKGALTVNVTTSAVAGTAGNLIFSYGTGDKETNIDTIALISTYKFARYEIALSNDETLVIGCHSTAGTPALTTKAGLLSQKFIIRKAHPVLPDSVANLADSLYYIVQDSAYRMMTKDAADNWSTLYSATASKEALWFIRKQGTDTYSITNFVGGHDLGSDDVLADAKLWDDKVFAASPTVKPYCEWKLKEIEPASLKPANSSALKAVVSDGLLTIYGTKTGDRVAVYNMFGQLVKQLAATTDCTPVNVHQGVYLIKVNGQTLKVVK